MYKLLYAQIRCEKRQVNRNRLTITQSWSFQIKINRIDHWLRWFECWADAGDVGPTLPPPVAGNVNHPELNQSTLCNPKPNEERSLFKVSVESQRVTRQINLRRWPDYGLMSSQHYTTFRLMSPRCQVVFKAFGEEDHVQTRNINHVLD